MDFNFVIHVCTQPVVYMYFYCVPCLKGCTHDRYPINSRKVQYNQTIPANCSWRAENHYFACRELLVLFGSLTCVILVSYNLHLTAVLTMAVAVTAEAMKGQGTIVVGTMASDMEIMKIDTEGVIGRAHIITEMTGREF